MPPIASAVLDETTPPVSSVGVVKEADLDEALVGDLIWVDAAFFLYGLV